jgi:hypothetical protein
MKRVKEWLRSVSSYVETGKEKVKNKQLTPACFVAIGLLFSLIFPIWAVIAIAVTVFYFWYRME